MGEVDDSQPMTHFWHQECDFWSSLLKACLPPEGRILRRVSCLKKNQNAPRPSDVVFCLDCHRIALIGRCLVKIMILIGSCAYDLKVLIGSCHDLKILIGTCLDLLN